LESDSAKSLQGLMMYVHLAFILKEFAQNMQIIKLLQNYLQAQVVDEISNLDDKSHKKKMVILAS
jgi:hypothetical protein